MEQSLTKRISRVYWGNMVCAASREVTSSQITVHRLNDLLVKVVFRMGDAIYMFRGMLTEQDEGLLMTVQNRVMPDYILSGIEGFVPNKSNVHGGFMFQLNAFYFHIMIRKFDGTEVEVYFLGKPEEEFRLQQEAKVRQFAESSDDASTNC
ncbi:hypothetical protein [Marinoscillum furvescens]|nr:hypothetical protein [Marinoscillum furvescens]